STVVVSRGLVGAWLTYRIADVRGIACGVEVPFIDRLLAEPYLDADATRAGLRALRRDQLAAVIASVLADPDRVDDGALPRGRGYPGDTRPPHGPARRA